MPIYEYKCENDACRHEFEEILSFSEGEKPQPCPKCGSTTKKLVSLSDFILKGDGWFGKAQRIKGQMKKKNERILERQKDRYSGTGPRIQPNVDGKPVDSWADAQKLAKEKGKIAETYQPMVEKEKRGET